jgi:hypothetical protein
MLSTSSGLKTIDKTIASQGRYLFYPAVNVDGGIDRARLRPLVVEHLPGATRSPRRDRRGRDVVIRWRTAPNTTGRCGDYFAVTFDPSNATNMWIAGEIGSGSGGGTRESGWRR